MIIVDGKGSGSQAGVLDNVLQTSTAAEALEANIKGDAYVAIKSLTTGAINYDFFYLKNNDERDLIVWRIDAWANDANQALTVDIGGTDAGTAAGDALEPANTNAGSGNIADVDCYTDDNASLAIVGEAIVTMLELTTTASQLETFDFPSGIILATNNRLHMAAALDGTIDLIVYFYFRD